MALLNIMRIGKGFSQDLLFIDFGGDMLSEAATLASKMKLLRCSQARKHWKKLFLYVNKANDRMVRSNPVFCQMTGMHEAKSDKII